MADSEYLRQQARKCRRLAEAVDRKDIAQTLLEMAREYEEHARKLQAGEEKA